MLTYRSKGVHTNRKGGKMARKAYGRDGKPLVEKKKEARKKRIAKAAASAMSEGAEQMAQDQARFSAEHNQAVAQGAETMRAAQQGTPGRAAEIIKNRSV